MSINRSVLARDVMMPLSRLITLSPDTDALAAVRRLLNHNISGAPVVDRDGRYLGVFSEKTAMQFLIRLTHDALPSNTVELFMNKESERTVAETTDLLSLVEKFLSTPYRRLPVLRDGILLGQISRRDVLKASTRLLEQENENRRRTSIGVSRKLVRGGVVIHLARFGPRLCVD